MTCMLNRKPYRDIEGNVRVRKQCCGKKTACTLTEQQPHGVIVKHGAPKRKKHIKKIVVVETPTKGKKK